MCIWISAACLHGYHPRWPALKIARFADAVRSVVAAAPGATPHWTNEECSALAAILVKENHAVRV